MRTDYSQEIKSRRQALGWSQSELGRRAGKVPQQAVHQLENGITKWSRHLDKILDALDKAEREGGASPSNDLLPATQQSGHFQSPPATENRVAPRSQNHASGGWLPVYASEDDGHSFWLSAHPVEQRPVPTYLRLVSGAYGVFVPCRKMEPRYEVGEVAEAISDKPVRPGVDALFYHREEDGKGRKCLLRRLVDITPEVWVVKQFNPPETYQLDRKEWPIAHPVVGRGAP